jgi:hypothetical protein
MAGAQEAETEVWHGWSRLQRRGGAIANGRGASGDAIEARAAIERTLLRLIELLLLLLLQLCVASRVDPQLLHVWPTRTPPPLRSDGHDWMDENFVASPKMGIEW